MRTISRFVLRIFSGGLQIRWARLGAHTAGPTLATNGPQRLPGLMPLPAASTFRLACQVGCVRSQLRACLRSPQRFNSPFTSSQLSAAADCQRGAALHLLPAVVSNSTSVALSGPQPPSSSTALVLKPHIHHTHLPRSPPLRGSMHTGLRASGNASSPLWAAAAHS